MTLLNLKSLRKRKIVDVDTAETIGRVSALQIDLSGDTPRVGGIVVKGRPGGVISHSDIIGFGQDAITVPDATVVIEDAEERVTDADARGSRLLDDRGFDLGKLDDMTMDEDGQIVSVTAGATTYEATLLGIGSYAVVISAADRA